MNSTHLRITFSLILGFTASIVLVFALQQSSMIGHAAGTTLCVMPQGESTGPFAPCDQVFTSVQDAVDTAVNGQEIWIASGVYTGVQARNNITQVVYLDKSVTLQGGYTIPFDTPPNPETNPTILDAEGNGRVIYVAEGQTVSISGLNLINGDATGLGGRAGSSLGWGGAIFATSATITITQSTIVNNIAESIYGGGFGGGIAVRNGTLYLHNSVVSNNIAASFNHGVGGGLALENSDFYIENNVIVNNTAVITNEVNGAFGAYGFGGGIAIGDASGTIINNQISENRATQLGKNGFGGGIYIDVESNQTITIQNNNISNNIALLNANISLDTYGFGGGIYIENISNTNPILIANISNNTLSQNSALVNGYTGWGGGIAIINRNNEPVQLSFKENELFQNNANDRMDNNAYGLGGGAVFGNVTGTLAQNRFISNTVARSKNGNGSALYIASGNVTLKNDLFQGNIADQSSSYGTVIFGEAAQATMINSVIIDNVAASDGSAITVLDATLNLIHPTIARNGGTSAILVSPYDVNKSGVLSLTNGLIVSQAIGIRIEDNSSLFVNGVMWHKVDTAVSQSPLANVTLNNATVGDPLFAPDGYHLTANSAARFAGVPGTLPYDIDGQGRPFNTPSFGADEYWVMQQYLPAIYKTD